MIVTCFFSFASSVSQSITAPKKPVITLEPHTTGFDLQERAFDAQGNRLPEAPANVGRLGEVKEVRAVHSLTLRFAETVTLTHIKSTPDFRIEQGGSCVEGVCSQHYLHAAGPSYVRGKGSAVFSLPTRGLAPRPCGPRLGWTR